MLNSKTKKYEETIGDANFLTKSTTYWLQSYMYHKLQHALPDILPSKK